MSSKMQTNLKELISQCWANMSKIHRLIPNHQEQHNLFSKWNKINLKKINLLQSLTFNPTILPSTRTNLRLNKYSNTYRAWNQMTLTGQICRKLTIRSIRTGIQCPQWIDLSDELLCLVKKRKSQKLSKKIMRLKNSNPNNFFLQNPANQTWVCSKKLQWSANEINT